MSAPLHELNIGFSEYLYATELSEKQMWGDLYKKLYELVEKYPELSRPYYLLAWLYFKKLHDWKKAEKLLKKVLDLEPTFPNSYFVYAELLFNQRRFSEEKKLLDVAEKIEGINLAAIYNEYALMAEAQLDFDKAEEYYKKAIENEFNPNGVNAYSASIKRCDQKREILEKKKA